MRRPTRPSLHVACMPFPTPQGTQALVGAMMAALDAGERRAHLLTYAHGEGTSSDTHQTHRLADRPRVRSSRSGPSLGKLALDARMVPELRAVSRSTNPSAIVAHNVEAALVAATANVRPLVYFAHTRFDAELPHYARPGLAALLEPAGRALDALACRGADHVVAVCPDLARSLGRRLGREVPAITLPWRVAEAMLPDERLAARASFGIAGDAPILLYAGNLDAYQGWEDAVLALCGLPEARLLVATSSDPAQLLALAREAGVLDRVQLSALSTEPARRRIHAAADLALVTRRAPGGLPIKLLDALSRGLPVVATSRATGGLALGDAIEEVPDDDPSALTAGARRALSSREARAARAREYILREHEPSLFVRDLELAIDAARRNHLERG